MKDDAEMVAQLVQDHTFEDFENVMGQRDKLKKSLQTCDRSSGKSGKHRQSTVAYK